MKRKIKKRWIVVVAVLLALIAWYASRGEDSFDTRFNGAYRLEDGRLVFVMPRDGETLRYRLMSGESAALRPTVDHTFEAGPGWSAAEPVEVTVTFDPPDPGPPSGLLWKSVTAEQRGERLPFQEVADWVQSGDLALRARLVLPEGEGPFPVVVFVHGSGAESAVDTYYNPYMMAAHGVAGLVYDKRGTGESEGEYNQNFHLLSDDTAAAVEWVRKRPEIDPANIHLAGYSQGGWIAPLAATKTEVRSLLINYGPMVPITGEDRWGYVYALEQAGFGEAEIREVDEINAIASDIVDNGADRWGELKEALKGVEGEDWYEALQGSDSMVGFLTGTRMPMWVMRLYAWWRFRGDEPFVDRVYDPVPTLASLDQPSLWIFGDEDSSMPTQWSIDELERLKAAGRPIEIEVFPDAEHGILTFEEKDGERSYVGYAPGYLQLQVDWVRRQAGLDPPTSGEAPEEELENIGDDVG